MRLSEIAEVKTAFERNQPIGQQGNVRAIKLTVSRSLTADTLETMKDAGCLSR